MVTNLWEERVSCIVDCDRIQKFSVKPEVLSHGGIHLCHSKELPRVTAFFQQLPGEGNKEQRPLTGALSHPC